MMASKRVKKKARPSNEWQDVKIKRPKTGQEVFIKGYFKSMGIYNGRWHEQRFSKDPNALDVFEVTHWKRWGE